MCKPNYENITNALISLSMRHGGREIKTATLKDECSKLNVSLGNNMLNLYAKVGIFTLPSRGRVVISSGITLNQVKRAYNLQHVERYGQKAKKAEVKSFNMEVDEKLDELTCIKFLQRKGYTIIAPITVYSNVTKEKSITIKF